MADNVSSTRNEVLEVFDKCGVDNPGLYLAAKALLRELSETEVVLLVSEVLPIQQPLFHTCEVECKLDEKGKEVCKENIDAVVKSLNSSHSELEDSISDAWWDLVSKAIDELNLPNVHGEEDSNQRVM